VLPDCSLRRAEESPAQAPGARAGAAFRRDCTAVSSRPVMLLAAISDDTSAAINRLRAPAAASG
jgi:hypothetical protein